MTTSTILYFVGVGVASAAVGFFIGWKLRGRKANKELDRAMAFNKHQMDILDKKLKDVRSSINANLAEKEKVWTDIANGDKETDDEPTTEVPKQKLEAELMYRRPEDKRINYNAISSGLGYTPIEDEPKDSIIRWESDNGVYEVTERDYLESKEYIDEEFEYYESSGDVWKDDELFDPDELPSYIGYSKDELAARFLYDEPEKIIVRNDGHERYYIIYWCKGMMPE